MASEQAKRNVLLASALGSSLAPFMVSGLIVALPAIGHEFSADVQGLSLLTNIFFVAAAVFLVPFGKIADTFGVKKIFTLGIIVYFISVFLCIIAPDIRFLTVARGITGIGAGMVFGTSIALLSLVFPVSERGKAIGVNVGAMSGGFLLGFLLGGVLTFYSGWKTIFFLTIPVEILVIWLIFTRIRGECELVRTQYLDVPGMIVYGLALFSIMFGFSLLPQPDAIIIILFGAVCLFLFLVREYRVNNPLINLTVLRKNRLFITANLIVILFNASNFAAIFLTSLYLQDVRNIDPRSAGLILLTTVIFMVLLSPFAGKLSDRLAPAIVIGAGAVLSSAGLVIFALMETGSSLFLVILALSLVGSGIAFCQSPVVRTTVSSVPKGMYGLASGMIETMRLVGMTISVAVAGIVFALFSGNAHISPSLFPAFMQSFRFSFMIFLGISIICLGIILTLKQPGGSGTLTRSRMTSSRFFLKICQEYPFSPKKKILLPVASVHGTRSGMDALQRKSEKMHPPVVTMARSCFGDGTTVRRWPFVGRRSDSMYHGLVSGGRELERLHGPSRIDGKIRRAWISGRDSGLRKQEQIPDPIARSLIVLSRAMVRWGKNIQVRQKKIASEKKYISVFRTSFPARGVPVPGDSLQVEQSICFIYGKYPLLNCEVTDRLMV